MTTMNFNQTIPFTHTSNYMQQWAAGNEAKTGGVDFFATEQAIVKGYKTLYEAMITDEEAKTIGRKLNETDDKVSVMAGFESYAKPEPLPKPTDAGADKYSSDRAPTAYSPTLGLRPR